MSDKEAVRQFSSIESFPDFIRDIQYNVLTDNHNINVVLSPSSIKCFMGLLYCAANGETAHELKKVLNIENAIDEDDVANISRTFLDRANSNSAKLTSLSHIFIDKIYKIKDSFLSLANENFDCEITQVAFAKSRETTKEINEWITTNSKNAFLQLSDQIPKNAQGVCLNITFFEAKWLEKFIRVSKKQIFTTAEGNKVFVNMMFQEGTFNYAKIDSLNAHAIQLPLANTNISMLIMLPKKTIPLEQMERDMRQLDFNLILDKLEECSHVRVHIPIFNIHFNNALKTTLQDMLIRSIFTENGDVSKMLDEKKPLSMQEVHHLAILELTTSGIVVTSQKRAEPVLDKKIENADSDIDIVSLGKLSRKFIEFTADYPFVFAILEQDHVYFTGHVVTFKTSKTELNRMIMQQ